MPTDTTRPDIKSDQTNDESFGYYAFVTMLIVTFVLLTIVLTMVSNHQRNRWIKEYNALRQKKTDSGFLLVQKSEQAIEVITPMDTRWENVPIRKVAMLPQNMTMPSIDKATISEVELQAIWDGKDIAFRLTWLDQSKDMNVDTTRFTDAIAIQLPLDQYSSFMMGNKEAPVQIIQWKALWQKDIDEHFQDVQDIHPNYWADFYWFAKPLSKHGAQGNAYRVPESFEDPFSRQWFTALQAQNPAARFDRSQPVSELIAEGFGSLVSQVQSDSKGRGVWKDGKWHVVIQRPMLTQDNEDFQFHEKTSSQISVAVWNGSNQNVGGRKQYANWIPFEIMP